MKPIGFAVMALCGLTLIASYNGTKAQTLDQQYNQERSDSENMQKYCLQLQSEKMFALGPSHFDSEYVQGFKLANGIIYGLVDRPTAKGVYQACSWMQITKLNEQFAFDLYYGLYKSEGNQICLYRKHKNLNKQVEKSCTLLR